MNGSDDDDLFGPVGYDRHREGDIPVCRDRFERGGVELVTNRVVTDGHGEAGDEIDDDHEDGDVGVSKRPRRPNLLASEVLLRNDRHVTGPKDRSRNEDGPEPDGRYHEANEAALILGP